MDMRTHLSSASVAAATLAVIYAAVSVAFARELYVVATTRAIGAGAAAMAASPWAVATIADYVAGAAFGFLFLFLRRDRFLGVSSRVVAAAFVFLGNVLLLPYVASLMVRYAGIVPALLPSAWDGALDSADAERRAGKDAAQIKRIGAVFALLAVAYFAVLLWAGLTESLMDGYRVLKTEPWAMVMFHDNLCGLLFTATFILARAGSFSAEAVVWLVLLAVLGNGITCAYVVVVAFEAYRQQVPFETALLTPLPHPRDNNMLYTSIN